jgi:hypothetical protein
LTGATWTGSLTLGCVSGCRDVLNNWGFGFVAKVYLLLLPEFDPTAMITIGFCPLEA